jgi:hypothetical protein
VFRLWTRAALCRGINNHVAVNAASVDSKITDSHPVRAAVVVRPNRAHVPTASHSR